MRTFFKILAIAFIMLATLLQGEEIKKDYHLELVKFYNSIHEYDLIVNHIDSLETVDYLSDSLKFFKAIAYNELNKKVRADSVFIDLIISSVDEPLVYRSFEELKKDLSYYTSLEQIDLISGVLNDLKYEFLRVDLLLYLAKIYEDNQLYLEANDVYSLVLAESLLPSPDEIKIKIATNLIFSESYQAAINLLKPISENADSALVADSHYLLYLSYFAEKQYGFARESLIFLYLNYPQLDNRSEVIEKLADIFYIENEYLLSWYFLEELRKISPERLGIQENISRIKDKISSINLNNPFKNLIFKRNTQKTTLD